MNYKDVARKILTDTLNYGMFTLKTGERRMARTNEILAVAKYVAKEGISEEHETQESNAPNEVLLNVQDVVLREERDNDYSR